MKKALAFSGGKDSMACLHLERETLDCAIYVDTGFSYPETQRLVEYAASLVPLHIVHTDRAGQNAREGIPADVVPINWTRLGQQVTGEKTVTIQSYLGCCFENVSSPLFSKAKELGVTHLIYGQRNEEGHKSPSRDGTVIDGITRLHPIEHWTAEDVLAFLATKMEVPEHYKIRHSSLDCYDCPAYRCESSDRIEWTREKYPNFYAAYIERTSAIDAAIREASRG